MAPKDFQKILLEAVEEGLSTLGNSPKQAILFHLEKNFKIKREEIPKNLTEFQKAIEKIFGPGATYLEKLILRRLYDKLQLEFDELENQKLSLLDSVENLKKHILFR